MKYISENGNSMMKELNVLKNIQEFKRVILPTLVLILFFIGAYITSQTPSKKPLPEGFANAEPDAQKTMKLRKFPNQNDQGGTEPPIQPVGMSGIKAPDFKTVNKNRCPNILIQHGSEIFLYNSKVEKVPGVNPIRFKNLEDYTEFMEWLQGRGIRCPVLFLQFSYDTQGKAVYKFRPSPMDLQGGLSPNIPYSPAPAALVQIMDASRDNPPFNNNMYDGFDPLNFNTGDYTTQDAAFHEKELSMKYSDNAMDSNWGGINYSKSSVESGAYASRTRPSNFPTYVSSYKKTTAPAPKQTSIKPNYYVISKPTASAIATSTASPAAVTMATSATTPRPTNV